jgi:hypothetical protein
MAFALLWEASAHMHDVISSLVVTPDGDYIFARSRFFLMRSQDKGNSWTPLRNPDDINWDKEPGGPPTFILSPDFKNDRTLLFGVNLSTNAGKTWSINLAEKLTRRKWRREQYEICLGDPNPVVFSADFANDNTIFTVACKQENPAIVSLLYSTDLGQNFQFVKGLTNFEFGSWLPVLTATTDDVYFQRIVGLDSEIYAPKSSNSKAWKRILTLENFEIQSIGEDHSSDGLLVIDRNSQTLYRLDLDADENDKLVPITLPSAVTAKSGDQLLISAYIHKGVDTKTSMFVLRSTCPGREERLRQLRVECPSDLRIDEDQKEDVLLSTDEGATWKSLTVADWFFLDGGGDSTDFDIEEFTFVFGLPGTPTVFLGTFTGLYRSEDHGESWVELDTIATDIIGMNAAKISSDLAQLSVCTYDDSCRSGVVDIGALRNGSMSRLPQGSLKKVMRSADDVLYDPNPKYFVYSTIAFSDGIGFSADKLGLMRYANGFDGPYTIVDSLPFVVTAATNQLSNVHAIKFSPNFKNDGTMFLVGFNLGGVFKSVDYGVTFENVFNTTTRPEVPAGADSVGLVVSPDFETTGEVFTYVLQPGSQFLKDSLLFISEDFGVSWDAVEQGADPQRMLSVSLAIDTSKDRVGKYSLLGNDRRGNIWVNRRKEEDDNKYGNWERLIYPVKGRFTSTLPKDSIAAKGFCHESILGTPNGELYMSMLTGGIAYGKLKGVRFIEPKANGLAQRFRFSGSGQSYVKNERKTYYDLLLEVEGVVFGAFFNEIWMSVDDGSTWNSVYNLDTREPRFSGCTKEDKTQCFEKDFLINK